MPPWPTGSHSAYRPAIRVPAPRGIAKIIETTPGGINHIRPFLSLAPTTAGRLRSADRAGDGEAGAEREAGEGGRVADVDREGAGRDNPAVGGVVEVRQVVAGQREADRGGLAGGQGDPGEALELAGRLKGSPRVAEVELGDLGARDRSRVGHRRGDRGEGPALAVAAAAGRAWAGEGVGRGGRDSRGARARSQVREPERRVRKAVAEREQRRDVLGVVAPVADAEALGVLELACSAGELGRLAHRSRRFAGGEGDRQLA